MKVGILTQPLRNNYGGILQNWALQHVLIGLGHDPITIDAFVKYPLKAYLKDLARWVYYDRLKGITVDYPHRYRARDTFKLTGKFVEKYIIKTRPLDRYKEGIIDEYGIDCVIVGSDQVWRPEYNREIENMFLDFLKGRKLKKIAYAASFGSNEWEYTPSLTEKCSSLIKQFDAVSVREASGVDLCKEHLGIEATHVLDPTLLVQKEDYESLCNRVPRKKESFLAVYCLDVTEDKKRLFNRIAERFNLKCRIFSADQDVKLSLPQWLAMFRDASMVVTDSFHGTVFSILFKKQFYSLINNARGNARVTSLLDQQLDLGSQIIDEDSTSFSVVDYEKVDEKLACLKQKSIQFLSENLS